MEISILLTPFLYMVGIILFCAKHFDLISHSDWRFCLWFSETVSTTSIGLFLHLLIPATIIVPLILSLVPVILPNFDATYFLFRHVILLPHPVKLVLRMILVLLMVGHGSILIYSCVINGTNVALSFFLCLFTMTRKRSNFFVALPKIWIIKLTPFRTDLMKYRQLQVLLTPTNHIAFIVLPFSLLVTLFMCITTGCMLVKFGGIVPLPIFMAGIFFNGMFVAIVHFLLPLLAEVAIKSEQFIRFSKVRNISKYRQQQLKSCRVLTLAIGPFLKVTKAIRIKYLAIALYNTVSLIILT